MDRFVWNCMARYRHYRHWSIKDILIFGAGMIVYFIMESVLPKIFSTVDSKLLQKISWGISIVVIFILYFAT